MTERSLFERALGLDRPWRVERTEFDAAERRLDLYVDFEAGGTFACASCGGGGCKAHDSSRKRWRHLDFFQHRAYLHARVPRVRCTECGVKLAEVPWARRGSGFTLWFEALVVALAREMPVQGGGPAGGRARHAAVASLEAPCGGGPGRGGLLRGARGGRGRDGVPAGPPLHHAVRGSGEFAASVRDAGARRRGRAPLPGGHRGARGAGRGDPGPLHGHVRGLHERERGRRSRRPGSPLTASTSNGS